MYATIGNIYHQYTPNVSIYTSTMDPMGYMFGVEMQLDISSHVATTFWGELLKKFAAAYRLYQDMDNIETPTWDVGRSEHLGENITMIFP
jgi:hypothetical protein